MYQTRNLLLDAIKLTELPVTLGHPFAMAATAQEGVFFHKAGREIHLNTMELQTCVNAVLKAPMGQLVLNYSISDAKGNTVKLVNLPAAEFRTNWLRSMLIGIVNRKFEAITSQLQNN